MEIKQSADDVYDSWKDADLSDHDLHNAENLATLREALREALAQRDVLNTAHYSATQAEIRATESLVKANARMIERTTKMDELAAEVATLKDQIKAMQETT